MNFFSIHSFLAPKYRESLDPCCFRTFVVPIWTKGSLATSYLIYLDISKTFDRVWHAGFLHKLTL